MASPSPAFAPLLNDGQRASLVAIADRIGSNGVIVADEVGMGKTRIAVFVAKAVIQSGGRSAIVIPPGLSFQWRKEFCDCGADVLPAIRSLHGYFEAWNNEEPASAPWFKQSIVMISHLFSNWRFGRNPQTWRWCLLPEVYAATRRLTKGRVPRGYYDAYCRDAYVQRVVAAAASITEANPACHRLSGLLSEVTWPDPLDPTKYGNHQPLRGWFEKVVGLGLGAFDLIIVDEAHKNRSEDGGLSTVVEKVVLTGSDSCRLALTATPIELDVGQWESTLKRIATTEEQRKPVVEATERYGQAIRRLRLGWRTSKAVRDEYREAAAQFRSALSPYLLRRDKHEDEDVLKFKEASGLFGYDYRHLREVAVEFNDLSPAWRQAVCAAEALSVVREPMMDGRTKRLRLTIGNGHGLAGVIDQAFYDKEEDKRQVEEDWAQAEDEVGTSGLDQDAEPPVAKRSAFWASVLRNALGSDPDILFDHPAILVAVRTIEEEIKRGEKVLVFGRFTRPMRALVSLLNARQMLKAIEQESPWPQTKVHKDEWPAVCAARRQLSSNVDLTRIDDLLAQRYGRESDQRARQREGLLARLRAGLADEDASSRSLAILRAIGRQTAPATDDAEGDEHHVALLARAIAANTDRPDAPDADLAKAFRALVEAAGDHDSSEERGEEFDEEQAARAWNILEEHLREGYTSQQGGFARLMYGETKPQTRRMIQLAFNRPNSLPRVLVAQSLVGREGLNLHESCRIVVLLHPEWNPGVVEQQIGRVDRVKSRWAKELAQAIDGGTRGTNLPRIEIRPIIFKGTYDEHNWNVLRERWDDLRAQLHGEAVPARLRASEDAEARAILDEIEAARPNFSPPRIDGKEPALANGGEAYRLI
jgi:superfamily II DNA or RNA helicase